MSDTFKTAYTWGIRDVTWPRLYDWLTGSRSCHCQAFRGTSFCSSKVRRVTVRPSTSRLGDPNNLGRLYQRKNPFRVDEIGLLGCYGFIAANYVVRGTCLSLLYLPNYLGSWWAPLVDSRHSLGFWGARLAPHLRTCGTPLTYQRH